MKKALFSLLTALLFFSSSFAEEGEKLFKGNCGVCHSIGKGKLVGPDLKGVNERHEQAWLLKWVKSSQTMIKSGDKAAVQLYKDNAGLVMQDFQLSDEEIKSILSFITEKEKILASAPPPTDNIASPGSKVHSSGSLLSMLGFSGYIMMMMIFLLLIVIWVMSMSIRKISLELKEKVKP